MRNAFGRGKIEDRPTPATTYDYRVPLGVRLFGSERRIALVVFLVLSSGLFIISRPCYADPQCYGSSFLGGVLVEAHGMMLDLLVIGLVVVWLNSRAQRAHESVQYQEEIDSLRDWKDREAGIRILHNIRRLNRNGITSIFLKGAVFDGLDLRGDGEAWATKRGVDLSGSYAPHASFVGSALTGLSLRDANLQQCHFTDAYCGKVDFRDALLMGADFSNAELTWADFTGAKHLLASQLAKARNLHGAVLGERLEAEVRKLNPAVFRREKLKSSIHEFFEMLDPHQLAEDFDPRKGPQR